MKEKRPRGNPNWIKKDRILEIDDYTEKPLSDLILELREILRRYRTIMTIKTFEEGGKISEIEITARIQI